MAYMDGICPNCNYPYAINSDCHVYEPSEEEMAEVSKKSIVAIHWGIEDGDEVTEEKPSSEISDGTPEF